jgi:hypothetical protein
MFVKLLLSSTAYSQKTVLIDGDTTICFSIPQSKFLLKQVYLVAEKDTLLKITETELRVSKEKSTIYEQQIQAYQQVVNNQKQITENYIAIQHQKEEEIKILKKDLAKQKVKTWGCILGGIVSTAFVSYLYISK